MDLFISFHSGCVHTVQFLSQIFLSISLPLFFPPSSVSIFSLFSVSPVSLQLCILASCWRVKSEWFVLCLWSCGTSPQQERQHKNVSICSNICFSFNVKHFSLQIPALFPSLFFVQFLVCSHEVCRGNKAKANCAQNIHFHLFCLPFTHSFSPCAPLSLSVSFCVCFPTAHDNFVTS